MYIIENTNQFADKKVFSKFVLKGVIEYVKKTKTGYPK